MLETKGCFTFMKIKREIGFVELELEALSLYLCADQATGFVRARGRIRDLRLLDISDRAREAIEFGVHRT